MIAGAGSSYQVSGLPATVLVSGSEGANDRAHRRHSGWKRHDQRVRAARLGVTNLTVDAGTGDDRIFGSQGNDILIGGDGNDSITGFRGDDVALMGAGNDTFVWNRGTAATPLRARTAPTRCSSTARTPTRTSTSPRTAAASASSGTSPVSRWTSMASKGSTSTPLGGTDTINVGDLTGTGVTAVNLNLASTLTTNAGDGQADSVIVNGTAGADAIAVAGSTSGITVSGLAASVHIAGIDPTLDRLTVNASWGAMTGSTPVYLNRECDRADLERRRWSLTF